MKVFRSAVIVLLCVVSLVVVACSSSGGTTPTTPPPTITDLVNADAGLRDDIGALNTRVTKTEKDIATISVPVPTPVLVHFDSLAALEAYLMDLGATVDGLVATPTPSPTPTPGPGATPTPVATPTPTAVPTPTPTATPSGVVVTVTKWFDYVRYGGCYPLRVRIENNGITPYTTVVTVKLSTAYYNVKMDKVATKMYESAGTACGGTAVGTTTFNPVGGEYTTQVYFVRPNVVVNPHTVLDLYMEFNLVYVSGSGDWDVSVYCD